MNLFSSEIFVFTPKGDIKTLPQGSTALDFAYTLHTNIGNSCIGAKVNHRLVPLSHPLSSGDQVEILTSRSQKPAPEWLNYVVTAKARTKIEAYLKRVRREAVREGERKLLEAFKKSGIEPTASRMDKVAIYYGFSSREDFCYAIEKDDMPLSDNLKKLIQEKTDNVLFKYLKQALRVGKKKEIQFPIQPESSKKKIAQYDRKKAYVLSENKFVHKISCPIATRLKSSFGERILSTVWSNHINTSFEATLEVKGIDSIGVLNTITKTISNDFNVYIQKLSIEAKDGVFEGKIKMMVHNVEDIQKLCVTLSKVKNVKSITRIAD